MIAVRFRGWTMNFVDWNVRNLKYLEKVIETILYALLHVTPHTIHKISYSGPGRTPNSWKLSWTRRCMLKIDFRGQTSDESDWHLSVPGAAGPTTQRTQREFSKEKTHPPAVITVWCLNHLTFMYILGDDQIWHFHFHAHMRASSFGVNTPKDLSTTTWFWGLILLLHPISL